MCGSSPDIPKPPPPPQEVKQPDNANLKDNARRNRSGLIGGGSLLTSASGVTAPAPTSKATLLGQ